MLYYTYNRFVKTLNESLTDFSDVNLILVYTKKIVAFIRENPFNIDLKMMSIVLFNLNSYRVKNIFEHYRYELNNKKKKMIYFKILFTTSHENVLALTNVI